MVKTQVKNIVIADVSAAIPNATNYVHPLINAADLIGIRRTTISRVLNVTPAAITQWATGKSTLPDHHVKNLRDLVEYGLTTAHEIHRNSKVAGLSPKETNAIAVYGARLRRADELMNEVRNAGR